MPRPTDQIEQDFLASCRLDNELIDKSIQAGLAEACFADPHCREQWKFMLGMRVSGQSVTDTSLYAEAVKRGVLETLGGVQALIQGRVESSLGGTALLDTILVTHAKREAWKRLHRATQALKDNAADLSEIRELAEEAAAICAGKQSVQRSLADIDAEIEASVKAAKEGREEVNTISWGVRKLDKFLRPIHRHEYVLVCARPSRGKSSMLCHVAGHNLTLGKKVAVFTLETSDTAVVQQIAAQMARVELDRIRDWMPDHHKRFEDARRKVKRSNLLVFDKELTLEAIQARCRLLASSVEPDLVIIDYLGLVATTGKSQYERVSLASKAMIPLRKTLGCPLLVGQQLNRSAESQDREPTMGDLRDSGQLEEDAHRIVMLHWTDSRLLDQETRPYKILQPKLRDGRTTAVSGIEFHAPTTTWREAAL